MILLILVQPFSVLVVRTLLNKDNSSTTNGGGPNAESRTNYAMELRGLGNHREASYQLQIAANEPYNYPRAMFYMLWHLNLVKGQTKLSSFNKMVNQMYIIEFTAYYPG